MDTGVWGGWGWVLDLSWEVGLVLSNTPFTFQGKVGGSQSPYRKYLIFRKFISKALRAMPPTFHFVFLICSSISAILRKFIGIISRLTVVELDVEENDINSISSHSGDNLFIILSISDFKTCLLKTKLELRTSPLVNFLFFQNFE